MQTFGLKDEHIKLGQLLKATGLVGSGVDAKIVVQEGLVKVNGKVCYMRGKKIVSGDIVEFENKKIITSFSTRKVTQFHPAIPLSKISRRESYAFLSC